VVHDGGDPLEQGLLIHFSDREAVGRRLVEGQLSPAAGEDRAAAVCASSCDYRSGDALGGACAAESEVDRWLAGVEELFQLGRQRSTIRQYPRAGLQHVQLR
jgi:hypothetical protein